jgi:branched-chain amino acid transport system substrate-binding protein
LLENTKDRQSALGVYSIDENGDTTLTDYGLYTIKNGLPTFEKVIKAQAG